MAVPKRDSYEKAVLKADNPLGNRLPNKNMGNFFGLGNPHSLARVIAKQEGFFNENIPLSKNASKRNNNPGSLRAPNLSQAKKWYGGNIKWDEKSGLAMFSSPEEGYYYLVRDLKIKSKGQSKSGITSESTIEEFVNKYVEKSKTPQKELDNYVSAINKASTKLESSYDRSQEKLYQEYEKTIIIPKRNVYKQSITVTGMK